MREVLKSLKVLAAERPDDAALHAPDTTLTYRELARRTAATAERAQVMGRTIGILAPNSVDWIVADLGLAAAGKTMVPLPPFFSPGQLQHIVRDARVSHVLCTPETRPLADALDLTFTDLSTFAADEPSREDFAGALPGDASHAKRIIYTSGTTGAPKGVRLGARQMTASTQGLMQASEACAEDHYLSVLPFSLLLEQIAAICLPLMAGATVTLAPSAAGAALKGDFAPLLEAFATTRPTTSVLVPGLLGAWVKGLQETGQSAPDSLRFIAVGGAHVPEALAEAAWTLGIPVHEGYGLSECCSVVSVNRPGARVPGTAGKVLDNLTVALDDGEIVVHGNTVMDGYLGHEDLTGETWRTGDLGEFTSDGTLKILGRKDRLIVTPEGRNIHPEWIETMALGVPGVGQARLVLDGDDLTLDITPTAEMAETAQVALLTALNKTLADAPGYARPAYITIASGNRPDAR